MSTIMKALRRLEQERATRVETERLHGEVMAPSTSASRQIGLPGGPAWWLALSMVILLAAAGGGWFWWGMPRPDWGALVAQPPASETAAAEPRSAQMKAVEPQIPAPMPVARARPAPAPPAQTPDPVAVVGPQQVAALPEPGTAEPLRVPPSRAALVGREKAAIAPAPVLALGGADQSATPIPPSQPKPSIDRSRKVSSVAVVPTALPPAIPPATSSSTPPPVSPPPSPAPVEIAVPITPAESLPAPASPVEPVSKPAPKPVLAAESTPSTTALTKPSTTALMTPKAEPPAADTNFAVVRTVWHPKPERRVAQISDAEGVSVQLHEGDLYQGLVIEQIQLSSVIFRDGDVTFSRRVSARR